MRSSLRQCIHARATFRTWKVPLAPLLPLPSPLGSTPPQLFISSKGERIPPPTFLSLSFHETLHVRLARMAAQPNVQPPSSRGIMRLLLWLQDFICRKNIFIIAGPKIKLYFSPSQPGRNLHVNPIWGA